LQVDHSNCRNNFAPNRGLPDWIREFRSATGEEADEPTSEHFIRAQAGKRIARQKKYRRGTYRTHSGRPSRSKRDTMHRQTANFSNDERRFVVTACTGSTGDEN
jgi:hypothetical protein